MVHVVWVNRRAFRLQWCQKCRFHCPPRTYHCPWCNICVEVSALFTLTPGPETPDRSWSLVQATTWAPAPVQGGEPLPVHMLTLTDA